MVVSKYALSHAGAASQRVIAAPAIHFGVDGALYLSDLRTFAARLSYRHQSRSYCLGLTVLLTVACSLPGQNIPADRLTPRSHTFFIDCSAAPGNGTSAHPWNSLAAAQQHEFVAGDRIAFRRDTVCHGSFAPTGSGTKEATIRLTAYGKGPRPRIKATSADREVVLLSNQEFWQVDSLDLSGANTYGVYVTGNRGLLHHIYLKNLFVHDVQGSTMKNKDNGLVVVGPDKLGAYFDDVLIDGVDAAHTNQWAGILVGGGPFYIPDGAYISRHVTIRNSTVHDVYGDGIVLFRDAQSAIKTSVAWETGMQPTQTIGTPNAIWTWTCTDCTVEDNEAFLTDSPGVDGGAYDIDWANVQNVVQRNFAHDTQGYCFAVFGAGYVTSESIVRDNLCVDNAQSPRLSTLQGAAYLSTWNGGVIRNLRIEGNTFIWNPPVASAAVLVDTATTDGAPIVFAGNKVQSAAPLVYRTTAEFAPSGNTYRSSDGDGLRFTLGKYKSISLKALQAAGLEVGSTSEVSGLSSVAASSLRLDATVDFALDSDGLLIPGARSQLVVLRSLARQYGPAELRVTVHLRMQRGGEEDRLAYENALSDLDASPILFDDNAQPEDAIRLLSSDGKEIKAWTGFQNASTLGGAVRALLGAPHYDRMVDTPVQ